MSNLGLQNVGSLTFCMQLGYSKKNCSTKKKFCNSKKNSKKAFTQKKVLLNMYLKKCCETKKINKGHITGGRINFNQKKKIKIEGVAFISKKYLKSHFSVFFQFRILRSVCICSLYPLQTVVQFDQISIHPSVYPSPLPWTDFSDINILIVVSLRIAGRT